MSNTYKVVVKLIYEIKAGSKKRALTKYNAGQRRIIGSYVSEPIYQKQKKAEEGR